MRKWNQMLYWTTNTHENLQYQDCIFNFLFLLIFTEALLNVSVIKKNTKWSIVTISLYTWKSNHFECSECLCQVRFLLSQTAQSTLWLANFVFFRGLNGWRWQVGKQKNWASNNQKMRQRKMFRDQVVSSIWCKSLEFYFTEGARNPKWRLKYEKSRFMVCVESRFKMAAEKPWRKSRRNSKLSLKKLQKTRIEMWRLYK